MVSQSRYIQSGAINAILVPNSNNNPLRIIRDQNGRIVDYTFDKASDKKEKEKTQGYANNVPSFLRPRPVKPLFRNGGVVKSQWGGAVDRIVDTNVPVVKDENQAKKDSEINERAARSYEKANGNVSIGNVLNGTLSADEQALIDAGGVIKTSDKVKLGAAITVWIS